VHAFDPTPASIRWVAGQTLPPTFYLHEYGLAGFDGEARFNPPENRTHISHTVLKRAATDARAISVPFKRLSTIQRELGHDHLDVLKMDIEGAEYGVIEDIERSDIRPGQVLVEFHHRFQDVGPRKTREAIARLRRMGYALFSVSRTGEEFGFIRTIS
jgi:FkbM family methyltransferase